MRVFDFVIALKSIGLDSVFMNLYRIAYAQAVGRGGISRLIIPSIIPKYKIALTKNLYNCAI